MIKIFEDLPDEKPFETTIAPWTERVFEDFHVAAYYDKYPVAEGHILFVPKFNTLDILSDTFNDAFKYGHDMVRDGEWEGFNIGMNYGKVAGQTVQWPHIHVIPRKLDDVEDPIGGVRAVIPGQGNYKSTLYKKPVAEQNND
jgi:diadenosine tetraphosphate (Ap4A) HIT family hydrolase